MNLPAVIVIGTALIGSAIAVDAARIDAGTHRLPNRHTASLAAVAVTGAALVALAGGRRPPLGAMALGAVLFAGPWLVAHLVSARSVGFGDVKLAAGLGLYIGWVEPVTAVAGVLAAGTVFLAATHLPSGSPVPGPRQAARRRPFGPALVVGAVVAIAAASITGGPGLW